MTDATSATAFLTRQFSDIIRDTLGTNHMKGPPMKITLRDDIPIVPVRITTARSTPIHWREKADAMIQEMISEDIIVPVHEPTEWLSPGFFVAKHSTTPDQNKGHKGAKDDVNLRFVCDLSKLNSVIKRNIHPFPSAKDIINAISDGALWFLKFDGLHGYHQIPLCPESQKLTAFLLYCGKFMYKRAAQGLSTSADEWNRRSDLAIAGMKNVLKIVDDVLVFASTLDELVRLGTIALQGFRDHNIIRISEQDSYLPMYATGDLSSVEDIVC